MAMLPRPPMTLLRLLLGAAVASATRELVAMVPALGDPNLTTSTTLEWLELSYDKSTNDARTVNVSFVKGDNNNDALGSWKGLDLAAHGGGAGGASLSAKVVGDSLYVLLEKGATPATAGGGCCADTLRVYDRLSSAYMDHDLDAALDAAFPSEVARRVSFSRALYRSLPPIGRLPPRDAPVRRLRDGLRRRPRAFRGPVDGPGARGRRARQRPRAHGSGHR